VVVAGVFAFATFIPPAIKPILAVVLIAGIFFWVLRQKNAGLVPVEIGSFYFMVVFLYATMPFIAFAVNSFEYHLFSDARLFRESPTPEEVAKVGYFYVMYLCVFATFYLLFRKTSNYASAVISAQPSVSMIIFLVFSYLLVEAPLSYLKLTSMGGMDVGYNQQYLWMSGYPLLARQAINHLAGISFVLQAFIIAYLFLRYRRAKAFIVLFLLLKFMSLVLMLGARTEFALLVAASIICYYNYVRLFSIWKASIIGVVFVGLFLLIGWGRDLQNLPPELLGSFFPSTEFESLFGNAFDIYSRKAGGGIDPPAYYPFEGILNIIPQQLLPLEKPSLSRWYVDSFYESYAEAGGGLAFGVVPEGLLSDSPWVAVFWRAAFHGVLLAWVFNIFHRSRQRPIHVAVYI